MKLNFLLRVQDYLQFNLYVSSKTERVMKRRNRNRLIIPIFYALLAAYFLYIHAYVAAGLLFLFGFLWFLFFRKYEAKRYVKYFLKHIQDNLSKSIDKPVEILLGEEDIYAKSPENESKMTWQSLIKVVEIPQLFLLMMDRGVAILIPKDQVDETSVRALLEEKAAEYHIPFSEELDWKWR